MELAQQAASWIENPQLAVRIMNFAIAHAYTVKQCLRREQLNANDLDGIVNAAEVCSRVTIVCGLNGVVLLEEVTNESPPLPPIIALLQYCLMPRVN